MARYDITYADGRAATVEAPTIETAVEAARRESAKPVTAIARQAAPDPRESHARELHNETPPFCDVCGYMHAREDCPELA